MPLIHGKSPRSFEKNLKTEMHEGKPLPQSLAIAYSLKRKAEKDHEAHGGVACHACGGPVHHDGKYAEGGFIHEEEESGYEPKPAIHGSHEYDHAVENQDVVKRAMEAIRMSHGGIVANEDKPEADFEPDEFDDLEKDDHLDFHESGAEAGDEDGDEQEDEDRRDIVARAKKSFKKKDRLPHPA